MITETIDRCKKCKYKAIDVKVCISCRNLIDRFEPKVKEDFNCSTCGIDTWKTCEGYKTGNCPPKVKEEKKDWVLSAKVGGEYVPFATNKEEKSCGCEKCKHKDICKVSFITLACNCESYTPKVKEKKSEIRAEVKYAKPYGYIVVPFINEIERNDLVCRTKEEAEEIATRINTYPIMKAEFNNLVLKGQNAERNRIVKLIDEMQSEVLSDYYKQPFIELKSRITGGKEK